MSLTMAESHIGFQRIASQLNYTRRFLSPTAFRVTIPTLPPDAFQRTGKGIQSLGFLQIIGSCLGYAFYNVAHASEPGRSLVDTHILNEDSISYILALKLDICREFHKMESPKFPLNSDITIVHSGTSSRRISLEVFHETVTTPYAKVLIDDVRVDPNTSRSVPFPDWWKKKYGDLLGKQDKPPLMRRLTVPGDFLSGKVVVSYEDIDANWHTHFTRYVKWCHSVLHRQIRLSNTSLTLGDMQTGLKSMSIIFLGESKLDDELAVKLWEDEATQRRVNFVVEKAPGQVCCHITMEFYNKPCLKCAL